MSESTSGDILVHDYDEEWFTQRGIDDERVIEALGEVPRKPFVLPGDDDGQLPSKVLPPIEVVGKLVSALALEDDDTVLEVGTDTGYISALLAELADQVYTVERRLQIAKLAEGRFEELDIENIEILYGPRLSEYALNAPYDAILVSAVAPTVPEKLKERLAVGGRLVVPIGEGKRNPEVVCVERVDEESFQRASFGQLRFSSKLGEILVELGVADREDVELAALEADADGKRIGEALLEYSHVQEKDLVRALAIQRGLKIAPVDQLLERANHELAFSVPRAFLEHHQVIPLVIDNNTLAVATVDPDAPAIELARILDADAVETYLVTTGQFQRIWNTILEGRSRPTTDDDTLKGRVESKFEKILQTASRLGASTIHIDTETEGGRVRFRLDDDQLKTIPEMILEPMEIDYLVEFLKIGADLDVLEQRIPQRGRFSWMRDARTYHLNVHVMPSVLGEQLSIQLLSHGAECPTLDQIGFPPDIISDLEVVLERLPGLLLIVGPRHIAKRDTLYALLSMLAEDDSLKVATVEEDVRYTVDNVQQALAQPDRDFGYRKAIREFVRFPVDVLGIDELPNPEIVLEAINAARRGPSVLATMHGHDAAHVVGGLREFGLPAETLAHGISAVLTQRSVSKICSGCRREVEVDDLMAEELFDGDVPDGFQAFRGTGCTDCEQTGVEDQLPLLELIPFGDSIRQAVLNEKSPEQIRSIAASAGLETLSDFALRLASQGKIPVDELKGWFSRS